MSCMRCGGQITTGGCPICDSVRVYPIGPPPTVYSCTACQVVADLTAQLRRYEESGAYLREALAAQAHESWAGWMRYMATKGELHNDGSLTLPWSSMERWNRQMATPYADLPEGEKKSDREEADRYLAAAGRGTGRRIGELEAALSAAHLSLRTITRAGTHDQPMLEGMDDVRAYAGGAESNMNRCIDMTCKPFSSGKRGIYSIFVADDGAVWVWDEEIGRYSTFHCLSRRTMATARRLAGWKKPAAVRSYVILRHGSNAANQSGQQIRGVAIVEASSEAEAVEKAAVECYANQHLSARAVGSARRVWVEEARNEA